MLIDNNVFVVTGAASGLGRATAAMLTKQGGKVVLVDLDEERGRSAAEEMSASFVRADVSLQADAVAVFHRAVKLGRLSGVVNCAGIAPAARTVGKEGAHPLELFQKVLNVNVVGTFNRVRLGAEIMAENDRTKDGERGVIINTASVAAYDGQIGQAAYAASKAAVAGMTLPLARDLARDAIRVMTVAPGIFETPMLLGMSQAVQDALGASVPFPSRLGKPDEYAMLVRHILENPMLNGEVIRLDGAIRMPPK
ncbi:3-hydroxy-2-methylbutyryl-CoA dehydrogenase [Burkholderia sp. KK1]|nr:3-hydroxy-2-methylbutyryl-CoA dehydrogenase [Burkholderia sp. KK1]